MNYKADIKRLDRILQKRMKARQAATDAARSSMVRVTPLSLAFWISLGQYLTGKEPRRRQP